MQEFKQHCQAALQQGLLDTDGFNYALVGVTCAILGLALVTFKLFRLFKQDSRKRILYRPRAKYFVQRCDASSIILN